MNMKQWIISHGPQLAGAAAAWLGVYLKTVDITVACAATAALFGISMLHVKADAAAAQNTPAKA